MENVMVPGDDVSTGLWLEISSGAESGGSEPWESEEPGAEPEESWPGTGGLEGALPEEDDYSEVTTVEFTEDEAGVIVGDTADTVFTLEEADPIIFTFEERRQLAKRECGRAAIELQGEIDKFNAQAAVAGDFGAKPIAAALHFTAGALINHRVAAQTCQLDPPRTDIDKLALATPIVIARYAREALRRGGLPLDSIGTASFHAADALTAFTVSMERLDGAKAAYRTGNRETKRHLADQLSAVTHNALVVDVQLRDLRNAIRGVKGPLLRISRQQLQSFMHKRPEELANEMEGPWRRGIHQLETLRRTVGDDLSRQLNAEMRDKISRVQAGRIKPGAILRVAIRRTSSSYATDAFRLLAEAALQLTRHRRIKPT